MKARTPRGVANDPFGVFTRREKQVAAFLDSDLAVKEIAYRLNLTLHSAKAVIKGLYHKADVRTRGDFVAWAKEKGR